jgi:glycine/D-amino acid oxidase-like deaminating enzyme
VAPTARTAAEVDALLGAEGLGPGLHIAEQGAIDPVEARRALAEALRAAGGELRLSWPVGAIGQESAGLRLEGPAGVLRAELVVVAAGAGAGAVQPWLRDKLWPVRAPVLRLAASPDRFPAPWVSQTGYVTGRTLPGGDVLLSGCRWASLEQGMGEEDEAAVDADMLGALRAFAGRFPDLAGAAERDRWSHVTAYSCDALPFVGPVPGRPRELCCAGFQGLDASLARVAAQAVAEGILRGRAETWPGWLSPGRMG